MKYSNPQIVLQEVPNEISLALSISGCALKCKGCHSKETWDKDFGKSLSLEVLQNLIDKNKYISCILFYGGEWELDTLTTFIDLIKKSDLKVALYSGQELSYFPKEFIKKLDYLKVGKYIKDLGGLSSKRTNQIFYEINNGELLQKTFY